MSLIDTINEQLRAVFGPAKSRELVCETYDGDMLADMVAADDDEPTLVFHRSCIAPPPPSGLPPIDERYIAWIKASVS